MGRARNGSARNGPVRNGRHEMEVIHRNGISLVRLAQVDFYKGHRALNSLFHFIQIFEFVVPLLEKQLEFSTFKKMRYSTTGEFVSIIAPRKSTKFSQFFCL